MKKISLLFASIVIVSFTVNAQERVKSTKDPVVVAPVEKPMKAERVTPAPIEEKHTVAEQAPHSDIQPTTKPVIKVENVEVGDMKTATPVKRTTNVKKHPVKPATAKSVAVPVMKAGEAK